LRNRSQHPEHLRITLTMIPMRLLSEVKGKICRM